MAWSALRWSVITGNLPVKRLKENKMSRLFRNLWLITLLVLIIAAFPADAKSPLTVHFLDVGKADCIVIQTPNGRHMLIDAGKKKHADLICSYLNKENIKKLDVVVGTHPHKDHIGALDDIIEDYAVGQVYLPDVSTDTKAYEDVRDVIRKKGLPIMTAKAGVEIRLDPALKITILAPAKDHYSEINNYSAVIKLAYRKKSFLFTGDAKKLSESEMLSWNAAALNVDVLKVGGHGDHSCTSRKFLKAVTPDYAVISTGADERVDEKTLDRLKIYGRVYRTDIDGRIIMKTDGASIRIITEKQ